MTNVAGPVVPTDSLERATALIQDGAHRRMIAAVEGLAAQVRAADPTKANKRGSWWARLTGAELVQRAAYLNARRSLPSMVAAIDYVLRAVLETRAALDQARIEVLAEREALGSQGSGTN